MHPANPGPNPALPARLPDLPAQRAQGVSSEQMYRELSEDCPVGIFHTDPEGRCIYTNPQWQQIYGLSLAESLGEGWLRGIHPDDRAGVRALWERITAGGETFDHTFRVQRPDGEVLHVRGRGGPVTLPDGSRAGYVGCVLDVSEEVRARRELQASEERLQRALDGSGLALWDLDVPSETIYLSETWMRMLGEEARELRCTAAQLFELVPPQDVPVIEAALAPVLAGTASRYVVEHRVRRSDGTLLWIHSAGRVAERDPEGRPLRLVGTNRDITRHKQAEEDLRAALDAADHANRAKSQFLATMSHEIRTPLNGIVGMTRLMLDEPLTPEVRRHADLIDSSAHSLLSLVNDVLDMSKIEAGQMEIESVPFDLHELIEDLATLYRLRATEKSLLFRVRLEHGVPRFVQGDSTRIRQVLVNLLGNALKFTPAGSVSLDIRASREPAAHVIEFTVTDTGIGIPPEVQPMLFKRFAQADTSTSRNFGGTGLGLAIVQQLVELMGGAVQVGSTPGHGSRFVVTLPLLAAQQAAPASAWQDLPAPAPGVRVLVAEDNTTNQVVAFGMLRKLGYEHVRVAGDGIEAYEMAMAEPFDVILMDCQMPEMDGYEATRRLRAAGCTAAIIAMTANAIKGDRERCLEAGMNDYVAKPVNLKVLRAMLARWSGAQPSRLGDLSSFDEAEMDSRFGGDAELKQVALSTFRQSTPPLLKKLRATLAAGNRQSMALLAHSAKGGGLMVAAERYAAIASLLEEYARGGNTAELENLLEELQRAFDDFVATVEAKAHR